MFKEQAHRLARHCSARDQDTVYITKEDGIYGVWSEGAYDAGVICDAEVVAVYEAGKLILGRLDGDRIVG